MNKMIRMRLLPKEGSCQSEDEAGCSCFYTIFYLCDGQSLVISSRIRGCSAREREEEVRVNTRVLVINHHVIVTHAGRHPLHWSVQLFFALTYIYIFSLVTYFKLFSFPQNMGTRIDISEQALDSCNEKVLYKRVRR